MEPTPLPFATQPPDDLAGWLALYEPATLPVLATTASELERWRAREDAADAHVLAEAIDGDPLMTLKLLARVARLHRRRAATDGAGADRAGDADGSGPAPAADEGDDAQDEHPGGAETVTAALLLLGIGPFFRSFGPQATAEAWLTAVPGALEGFRAVLARAYRAAAFALAFAAHRLDPDAAVIHAAALMHELAELLLWLRAPTLAGEIARRQAADPALRSAQAQRAVLGVELAALQPALLRAWGLAPLLVRITDDHRADDPQVRNVRLAIRVARHSARGWDNPALPDDVRDVAALLQLGEGPTRRLLHDIDAEA